MGDSDKPPFCVVEFLYSGTTYVSTAPGLWLSNEEDTIVWPKYKKNEGVLIKKLAKPESDWKTCPVLRVVGRYATFQEAYRREKLADKSSSESDGELVKLKRKRKVNSRYADYDEDSISPPPHFSRDLQKDNEIERVIPEGNEEEDSILELEDEVQEARKVLTDIVNAEVEIVDEIAESAPSTSGNDESLRFLIIELKNIMNMNFEMINHRLGQIESKLGGLDFSREDNLLPKLPIESIDSIETIELTLQEKEAEKQLLSKLRFVGGNSAQNCITRILERVFTNYAAKFCSWHGKKGNFKLKDLTVMRIVRDAVEIQYPAFTNAEFEKAVMAWFQHANTRYNREK